MQGDLKTFIYILIVIVWFLAYVVWGLRRKFGRTKTVHAEVVNKQVNETFSKNSGKKMKIYFVTFLINGKRKSFRVSELSYKGYHIGEKGTLEYRADRLLNFR